MNRLRRVIVLSVVLLGAGLASAQDEAGAVRAELYANVQEALEGLFNTVEGSRSVFNDAEGYAVLATPKAGFIITGGSGRGVAIDKSTGQVVYMRMGMGGIGPGYRRPAVCRRYSANFCRVSPAAKTSEL